MEKLGVVIDGAQVQLELLNSAGGTENVDKFEARLKHSALIRSTENSRRHTNVTHELRSPRFLVGGL